MKDSGEERQVIYRHRGRPSATSPKPRTTSITKMWFCRKFELLVSGGRPARGLSKYLDRGVDLVQSYFTPSNSTSNIRVEFPGISGGLPSGP